MNGTTKAVYVFKDIGYETGMKIGYGAIANCLHEAQGYSPRGIECVAAWPATSGVSARSMEKDFHDALVAESVLPLEIPAGEPRNGTEWFECTSEIATQIGRELFDAPPALFSIAGTRQDKVLSSPERERRLLLWVFQECETGRVKLNCCSGFRSPIARHRRYSRNGYREMAAYSVPQPFTLAKNHAVANARLKAISMLGAPKGRSGYGWLNEGVTLTGVTAHLNEQPWLVRIDDITERPKGVRPSYTGTNRHVPLAEHSDSDDVWWQSAAV